MLAITVNFDEIHDVLLTKIDAGAMSTGVVGDLYIDFQDKKIIGPKGSEVLPRWEYQIFWLLSRGPGSLITRDEMCYFMYDEDEARDIPLGNAIEVYISRIRKRLQRISARVRIETHRSFGYMCTIT
jgi:DNA-binding response OmpR family regulator